MIKKIFFLLFSTFVLAQHNDIYGLWVSQQGEFVVIKENNTFQRFVKNDSIRILAKGDLDIIDNQIFVFRKDTLDSYSLCFYRGNETMTVCKPRENKAWLFYKIR